MVELKYRRAVRNNEGQWLDRKIAPIDRTELPLILFQPAKDQFPLIEKALLTKYNLKIPDSCKVEHLLAAVSVDLANLIIEDNKLPINTAPNDVFLF